MKKRVILGVLLAFMTFASVQAAPRYKMAIGGEFGLPIIGGLPSAMLTFRLPTVPCVFGLGAYIPSNGGNASFALMADWWLWQGNLVSFINLYVGPGLYMAANSNYFDFGVRVPIGFNAFPIPPLELFVEIAPAMDLYNSAGGVSIPNFGLQAGFGFRFWF